MSNVIFDISVIENDFFVVQNNVAFNVENTIVELSVSTMGAKGLKGDKGDAGEAGAPGSSYTHNQSTANTVWNIPHNMGFYPNVSVRDSTNRTVLTDINYLDINTVQVIVANAFAGTAYLS